MQKKNSSRKSPLKNPAFLSWQTSCPTAASSSWENQMHGCHVTKTMWPSWLHSLPAGPLGNEAGRPDTQCQFVLVHTVIQCDCEIFWLFVLYLETGFSLICESNQSRHGSHFSASNSRAIPTESLELENQTKCTEVNCATMWVYHVHQTSWYQILTIRSSQEDESNPMNFPGLFSEF